MTYQYILFRFILGFIFVLRYVDLVSTNVRIKERTETPSPITCHHISQKNNEKENVSVSNSADYKPNSHLFNIRINAYLRLILRMSSTSIEFNCDWSKSAQ